MTDKEQISALISTAFEMLPRAYAPYSHYHVGAALLASDGRIFTGCNIENASYGATNCAERTAFFKAVSEGERKFAAICIAGGPEGSDPIPCPPCGICRQVMREFCRPGEFEIILAKDPEQYLVFTLEDFLPMGFGPDHLEQG